DDQRGRYEESDLDAAADGDARRQIHPVPHRRTDRRGRFGGVTGNRDYHQADEEIAEAECASGGLKRTGQDFTEPAHEAGSHREHAERRRTAPDRLVLDPLRPADREQLPMSM